MKSLKILGLILFVAGFFLFNASFFWADYTLTRSIVEEKIADSTRRKLFVSEALPLLGRPLKSNFDFVSELSKIFESINARLIKSYSISEEEITKLAQRGSTFSLSSVDSVFRTSNETASFKSQAFKDFGSYLEGKKFDSDNDLVDELKSVSDKIAAYGIINKVGFDRYAQKDLKYALTKASAESPVKRNPTLYFFLTFGLCILGAMLYILPKAEAHEGIKNNNIFFNPMKNVGWLGILTGTWLIVFYIVLYFFPEYMTNWIIIVDPISKVLNGNEAGRFFLYGFIYTLCILVMGVRMIIHYRHSRYQIFRTISVMFFQTAFAFLIPEF